MTNEKPQKPEVVQPKQETTMEAAIRAVANEIVPAAVLAAINASRPQAPAASPRAHPLHLQKCTECGQAVSGCHGKHTEIVVYPLRYEETAEFFPGVFINGVKYLSNDPGHKVVVPLEAANGILQTVQHYEQSEHEARAGRVKNHNSGRIGPNGASFNPANAAWR